MMPYGSSWEEELNLLFAALPPRIAAAAQRLSQGRGDLLEVVLDLGREPEARFTDGEAILNSANVGNAEIDYVTEHVGLFGDDNRAGIERTLHRISAIRNRKGNDRRADLPGRAARSTAPSTSSRTWSSAASRSCCSDLRVSARRRCCANARACSVTSAASAWSSSTRRTRSPAMGTSRTRASGVRAGCRFGHRRSSTR